MERMEHPYRTALIHRKPGRPRNQPDFTGKARKVSRGAETVVLRAFAEHLRFVREEAGISVTELAAAMGMDPQTMWNYESGRSRPSIANLIRLAMALGVPLDHLIPEV